MIVLLRLELLKLYRRFAPYVVYLAIMGLISLMIIGFKVDPPRFLEGGRAQRQVEGLQILGSPLNGLLMCEVVLRSLALLLPFLAPIVAGEVLGGEGGAGTLRTILVRPRSRHAIWWAKYLCVALYTLSLSAVTMGFSLGLGWLVFGGGKLWEFGALQEGRVVVLTTTEALRYLTLAYLLQALAVFVTASLAVMLASFLDNGLAPGFIALGLVVSLWIVSTMQFEWVETIRPYLFTSQLARAGEAIPTAFDPETQELILPVETIRQLLRVCGGYIVVFAGVGWWRFARRDITC